MPWRLGPPDGRYLLRASGHAEDAPSHVIVLATLGAHERRRLARRSRDAPAGPEPTPVATTRATVIDATQPDGDDAAARTWLQAAGEDELDAALTILNAALHGYRLVTADPYLNAVGRRQVIVARLGFGIGEQVAEGQWTQAREFEAPQPRRSRARVLHPQARLAAVLGAREPLLACEELALRARLDLDQARDREAALQLVVALDAAIAELGSETSGPGTRDLAERVHELRALRDPVGAAAQTALAGPLSAEQRAGVEHALGRIEAALRARAVASA